MLILLWVINMGKIAYHKKNTKNYVQYSFRIEEDILDKIRDIATKEGMSINDVLNQSLRFAVNDYDNK